MVWLLLSLACGPKRSPEVPPVDPEAPPDAADTRVDPADPAPPAAAAVTRPSTPLGPPGTPLDADWVATLEGAWVDGAGALLRILGPERAQLGGQEAGMMALSCAWGDLRVPCLGLELAPAVAGTSRLLLLAQQADGRLIQVNVGPYYQITGLVAGGQTFSPLVGRGGGAVPQDQRLLLGVGGTPLFCTSEGAASLECGGYHHAVDLLPLYSPAVERSRVVLASASGSQGCDAGVRVVEELGGAAERTLPQAITPVVPREADLAKIARALRASPTDVRGAWRVDLSGDGQDELLFEVAVPVGAGGQPPRAAVGVLSGELVVVLASREARNALDTAPSVRVSGLADPFGDGHLAVLLGVETDRPVGWELLRFTPQGPVRVYGLSCG